MDNSKAEVTVYAGSSIVKQYSISPGAPAGESGLVYEVFTLNAGAVTDVLKYNDALPTQLVATPYAGLNCDQVHNY